LPRIASSLRCVLPSDGRDIKDRWP
jgi:hypothetical protein